MFLLFKGNDELELYRSKHFFSINHLTSKHDLSFDLLKTYTSISLAIQSNKLAKKLRLYVRTF